MRDDVRRALTIGPTASGLERTSTDGSGPCVVSPATWLGFASIIDFTERTHRLRIKVIGSRACWERQPHRRTHRRTHLGIASFPRPRMAYEVGAGLVFPAKWLKGEEIELQKRGTSVERVGLWNGTRRLVQ